MEAATRAYIEGRYDEVALTHGETERAGSRGRGAAGARRHCPRPLSARGNLAAAAAARAPTSDAALELGLLSRCSAGRTRTDAHARGDADAARTGLDGAGARAFRALGQGQDFHDANDAYRDAVTAAPHDAAINTAWGDLFLEKAQQAEAVKSYRRRSKTIRGGSRRSWARRARSRRRPAAGAEPRRRRSQINPSYVDAYVFVARSRRWTPEHRAEARELLQKALAINPSSLDAHAQLGALAYVEDKKHEFEAEVGQGAGHRAALRRGLPRRGRAGRAQLPLRRGGGVGARGARELTPNDPRRARRPRLAAAAHRRRSRRAAGARSSVQDSTITTPSHSTCSTMLDTPRQVRHRARRRPHLQDRARTRRPCCRSTRWRWRTRRSTRLRQGTSSRRRGRFSSRCFPSTTTSPSGRSACPA